MTVRRILEIKGREVVTIDPATTLAEAVKTLAERRIGVLVVTGSGGDLQGILSERDVVRLVAGGGMDALSGTVGEVMTREVTTAGEDTTVDEAMEIMTRRRFRHLPVCEGGRLVGIVSIGDVVKRRIEAAEQEAEEMRSYIHAAAG
ncbi:CBS domain-containing protein [Aureimonas sp. Leaf324]|uniref:CBS domain-containing protein n=1 Tax=Aureimonas sp. Leaf324 TaxID=1736336 RepID=UPI0006FFD6F7|nr:CBS domain-containing protein [Aureimonas sp. Leaf324]KQQ88148.1 inosine-5-monophosphate dehydrogenase [Aureimonas sp. Leaf324]